MKDALTPSPCPLAQRNVRDEKNREKRKNTETQKRNSSEKQNKKQAKLATGNWTEIQFEFSGLHFGGHGEIQITNSVFICEA